MTLGPVNIINGIAPAQLGNVDCGTALWLVEHFKSCCVGKPEKLLIHHSSITKVGTKYNYNCLPWFHNFCHSGIASSD